MPVQGRRLTLPAEHPRPDSAPLPHHKCSNKWDTAGMTKASYDSVCADRAGPVCPCTPTGSANYW
ncbi:hypothetical protein GCM10010392_44710 [Streptomyces clavifer]|nr:hypothetical protein GCM10010392_44710 [Streptomyces clavifer]